MAMDNKPPLSRRPVICGAAIAPAGAATSLAPSIAQEVYGSAGGSDSPEAPGTFYGIRVVSS